MARWPHILQIQTLPVNERTTIGVVDLRTCLQAIAQCSPEIVNQQENDYTVYAVDYSEPDTPLVGQGMLSWGLEFASDHNSQRHQQQQLVTGRVTRSLLPVFSNGSRETLEVKMKLTAVAKMQRLGFSGMDNTLNNMLRSDPIQPTDITTSEWASFIQSNPGLGSSANMASMHSPAMSTAPLNVNLNGDGRYNMDIRSDPPPPPLGPLAYRRVVHSRKIPVPWSTICKTCSLSSLFLHGQLLLARVPHPRLQASLSRSPPTSRRVPPRDLLVERPVLEFPPEDHEAGHARSLLKQATRQASRKRLMVMMARKRREPKLSVPILLVLRHLVQHQSR